MSTLGSAAKVGIVVCIAAVCIFFVPVFFNAIGFFRHTYTLDVLFENVDGISVNGSVELAGVQVGQVKKISLTPDQKADLTLEIKDKVNGEEVHIPKGSQFTVTSALLGGSGVVMIIPPADAATLPPIAPDTTGLVGTRTGDITASLSHANTLLDQLTTTTRRVDSLLSDPAMQKHLQHTVANLDEASTRGVQLTNTLNKTIAVDNTQLTGTLQQANTHVQHLLDADNSQLQALLSQTRVSSKTALNNLTDTTAQIKGTTTENRAKFNQIIANLNDTTAAVAGITQQTSDLFKTGGLTQNLSASVANLKATTDKLNSIAGGLQNVATDPAVQSNLKETVANIKDSTEETKLLLQRLNKLAGTKRPAAAVVVTPGGGAVVVPPLTAGTTPAIPHSTATVPLILPRVDLIQNARTHHFRADVDAVLPLPKSPTAFARAGVYGLGDASRLNLQYGSFTGRESLYDYRYGLYASRLALGGDIGLGRRETLSFDVFDPNLVHVNAHGTLMLAPELGLLVGGEDLTRRGGFVFGLEYRITK
jgi:phospholipid/cholesterol/gamma-HCH transport system substrate-binding protein